MDLLGNRASTKAKIQHFDTTKEQIQTRKAVVARNILRDCRAVAEGQEQADLRSMKKNLVRSDERIQTYKDKISLNEQELDKLQNELKAEAGKVTDRTDRLSQRVFPSGITKEYYRAL